MILTAPKPIAERQRHLLFMTQPSLWPVWPLLPLIRRKPGGDQDEGLLYDVFHKNGRGGYSATVWLCNLFLRPELESQFLALPKEVYDRIEEVYEAGWRID
jgi:hypothetical protein